MKRIRFYFEYILFLFFKLMVKVLPFSYLAKLSDIVSSAVYPLMKRRKKYGIKNIEIAFKESSDEFKKNLLKKSYSNFLKVILETMKFNSADDFIKKRVKRISLETAKNALEKGKGVIFVTAHLGNFDYGAVVTGKILNTKINVVTRKLDNPLLERWAKRWRESEKNRVIYKKNSAVKLLRALKRGESIGIVVDQNQTARDGIFVDFFGIKASTTPAPAYFHLKTGAPIVPVFCVEEKDGYHLYSLEEIHLNGESDEKERIREITEKINRVLEREIKKYPEQWFWFHRRWNTTPDGKDNFYSE